MYKIIFYVPVSSCEVVKSAIFKSGAGHIGNYDNCSFETMGTGQFRALDGANPHIGNHGVIEKVEEIRVETICPKSKITQVLASLREAHPYEEPAIDVFELVNL